MTNPMTVTDITELAAKSMRGDNIDIAADREWLFHDLLATVEPKTTEEAITMLACAWQNVTQHAGDIRSGDQPVSQRVLHRCDALMRTAIHFLVCENGTDLEPLGLGCLMKPSPDRYETYGLGV